MARANRPEEEFLTNHEKKRSHAPSTWRQAPPTIYDGDDDDKQEWHLLNIQETIPYTNLDIPSIVDDT